jgi:hypothetical protein
MGFFSNSFFKKGLYNAGKVVDSTLVMIIVTQSINQREGRVD